MSEPYTPTTNSVRHAYALNSSRADLALFDAFDRWLAERDREVAEKAWGEGYISGHSNAMRRMSDEPSAPTSPNPYRRKEQQP